MDANAGSGSCEDSAWRGRYSARGKVMLDVSSTSALLNHMFYMKRSLSVALVTLFTMPVNVLLEVVNL